MYFGLIHTPREFLRYVYALRYYLLVTISIFVFCIFVGYAISVVAPSMVDTLLSGLEEKAKGLGNLPIFDMAIGIFTNNAFECLLTIVLGPFLGIFPAFFIAVNGVIIGVAMGMVIAKYGVAFGILIFILGLAPHGIFELTAVFISTAIGLKLGYDLALSVVRSDIGIIRKTALEALQIYVFWILPILFVAAFIEAFITGALLGYVKTP